MIFLKKLFDLAKILLITFIISLVIDFFLGSKILKYFDTYFAKSQFYERLIRIDHPIYHHTLRANVKYTNNVSFIDTYELCTNNHGFKSKCNQITDKNYDFAFIGDSFTLGGLTKSEFTSVKPAFSNSFVSASNSQDDKETC